MAKNQEVNEFTRIQSSHETRRRLLAGIPVMERQYQLAGIRTAVLEGGDGRPIVLLHGPGESGVKWLRVIPELVATHRVIAPDLPGHGNSEGVDAILDAGRVLSWLGDLIEKTCSSLPVLIGQALGGAIAARFAVQHSDLIKHLVLQDSLGLAPFRPSVKFAASMLLFLARPTEKTYDRFMRQCSYDLDGLREEMGDLWQPFASYNIEFSRGPGTKAMNRMMREVGVPQIPPEDLAKIAVPTTLIWGRYDRAIRFQVAENVSNQYGWPLHIIENCADDSPRDKPEAFLKVLQIALGSTSVAPAHLSKENQTQKEII